MGVHLQVLCHVGGVRGNSQELGLSYRVDLEV